MLKFDLQIEIFCLHCQLYMQCICIYEGLVLTSLLNGSNCD